MCEQVAKQVPKEVCRQEERQECYNIPRQVPREECTQVAREQCRDVPRQTEIQECFKVTSEWKSLISFFTSSLIFSLIPRFLENNAARSPRKYPERSARWETIIMFWLTS